MIGIRQRRHSVHAVLAAFSAAAVAAGCDGAPTDALDPGTPSASVASGGGAAAFDAEVPLAWFGLAYDLTRDEGFSPPVASRAFGYQGVALWEAVRPGVLGGRSLAGQLNGLQAVPRPPGGPLHWPTVANAALATIMRRFYGQQLSTKAILDLEAAFNDQFRGKLPGAVFKNSIQHGHRVANAIWEWSTGDGFDVFNNCAFTPPVGTGLWVPTPPAFAPALQPCWGQLRTMAVSSASACDPGPHPPYSEDPASAFYAEAFETYDVGNNLTQEQIDIAVFWADGPGTGTPAGHSISITSQVLASLGADLALAAEAYGRIGVAETDAFISVWWSKFTYNLLRPVTYINNVIDPSWSPLFSTPPFPEYTSGHSGEGGAAAQVRTDLFGDNFAFTDHTHDELGLAPRSFNSFFEAAEETAISRLYGGIHFRSGNERGVDQGICVGEAASALEFRHGGGGGATVTD